MKRKQIETFVLIISIFIISFFLRLYKINIPLADHHSWRQADTAAVARNFVKEKWNFLKPTIDNMTYLHSPNLLNNERLFMAEPPVYQTIVAAGYQFFGVKIELARLVSILFSLGSMWLLLLLARKYFGFRTGFLSALIFGLLPYSIYYSRVVLPESMIIFTVLGLLYFFDKWLDDGKKAWWAIALIFGAIALTQKSFPIFMTPVLVYMAYRRFSFGFLRKPSMWAFALLIMTPFVLWRLWVNNFPAGVPPFDWLLNQGDIRFKGAFFWWIFAERIGKLILGYWGLIPLGLGLALLPSKKEGWTFHLWLLMVIVYATVFAAGNVTHDYYQVYFVPIVVIFVARGIDFLFSQPKELCQRVYLYGFILIFSIFSLSFSWYEVRNYYNIQGGVDLAGQAVDELTPKNSLVLTGDSNDATLLYNTNRYGWSGGYASYFPNTSETIDKIIKMGGSIYVTTKFEENSSFGKYMLENFRLIKRTNQYIIFSLK